MSEETKSWTVSLQVNPYFDDFYIEFPEEMLPYLVELGWKVGDDLQWVDNQDGSFTVKKKEQE